MISAELSLSFNITDQNGYDKSSGRNNNKKGACCPTLPPSLNHWTEMLTAKTHVLSEPDHIFRHADRIAGAEAIGVDTEFVRERTYFPIPGLLQFSDGKEAWLVDPVELKDEPALRTLVATVMDNASMPKILHSVGEDLEIIDMTGASRPCPLFDTQRAAALLGWPLQIRYELLAKALLDIEFPGGLARNDWCRRPLPAAWIAYAANDVIALPRMREILSERLELAGRLHWLNEDCRRIVDRQGQARPSELRIKGAAGLSDAELERLARLARWREAQAQQRDIPRGFVVTDSALLTLARRQRLRDRDFDDLADGRNRIGKRDRAAILEQLEAEPADYQRPAELILLTGEQRARIKALQDRVKNTAEQLGIEPAVIASKRDLTRIVQGMECDWLDGWRGELLGDIRAEL